MAKRTAQIGSVRPRAGTLVRGHLEVLEHPHGHTERLPLVVVRGTRRGPTVVLSANIHGDELTGLHVIHDLLVPGLAQDLRGTLIALPTLNPTGLALVQRRSTFDQRDPNRMFPDPKPRPVDAKKSKRTIDRLAASPEHFRGGTVARRVYEFIQAHADAYLDLHTATTWSVPLTFLDPVFYGKRQERTAAKALLERTRALAQAIGLTIVREEPLPRYLDRSMQRTSTGSVLNGVRIPALTLELGMSNAVDPVMRTVGVRAVRNALRHLGMLEGNPEPHPDVPVASLSGHMRGIDHPRAAATGVVRFHVQPGQPVRAGDRIATIRRLDGRTAKGGVAHTELDGTVLWLRGESVTYPGTPLCMFGVEDDLPLLLPWPRR